jgi:hypothetical protein
LGVLIVAHHRKSGGDYGEGVRGANALVGAVDVVLEVERLPAAQDATQRLRLLRSIGRFDEVPDLVIELAGDDYVAHGSIEAAREERQRDDIVKALQELGRPSTTDEVAMKLGLASGTARGRLHALHRQHAIHRTGEGKRGDPHYWSAARPQRTDIET